MAAGRGSRMNMQEVTLLMIMVVALMQQVSRVQTRHLTTSSTEAAPLISLPAPAQAPEKVLATPAPSPSRPSTSRSSGGGPVTYIVGDSFGWTVPTSGDGATAYSIWASDKTFNVGDILEFNFANQAHSVAEVTRTAFDSCETTTTAYLHMISTSPARITLTSPGSHYFICTFPQHCSLGQKLAINVTSSSPTPPASSINATPPPSTSTTPSADGIINAPPAAPSSAPPSMMAALPVALLSILALAVFFC